MNTLGPEHDGSPDSSLTTGLRRALLVQFFVVVGAGVLLAGGAAFTLLTQPAMRSNVWVWFGLAGSLVLLFAGAMTIFVNRFLLTADTELAALDDSKGQTTESSYTAQRLEFRLRFEEMLSRISAELISLHANDIDRAIESSLQSVANFLNADRGGIVFFNDSDPQAGYEWSSPEVASFSAIPDFRMPEFAWMAERLVGGEAIVIRGVSTLPEAATLTKKSLGDCHIRSCVVAPLAISDEVIGQLSFVSTPGQPDWSEELAELVRRLGEILVNALERKRVEVELAATQAILSAAVDASRAGIIIADAPDGRIRTVNAAALGIRGPSFEQLSDIPIELHPERWNCSYPDGTPYRPEDLPLSQAIINGKVSENVTVIIQRASGERRWVLANAAPIRGADAEVVAGVVVFQDVTELKESESQLRNLNIELERRVSERTADLSEALVHVEESERRLSAILDNTSFLIGLCDARGNVLLANQSVLEYGYPEAAWLGSPLWEGPAWPSDEDREKVREAIQTAGQGTYSRCEVEHRHTSGERTIVDFSVSPICDETGKVVMLVPEGRDISELKRIEYELRDSEEKYRVLIENLSDEFTVYTHAPDGVYTYASPSLLRLLGMNQEDVIGKRWQDVLDPVLDSADEAQQAFMKCLDGEIPKPFVLSARLPTKTERQFFEVHGRPIFDKSGTVTAVSGITRNVTEFRKSEAALREAKERAEAATRDLEKANDDLKAYTRSVTHDLGAPVRAMEGFALALAEDYGEQLDEVGLDYIHRIQRSAQRMELLIRDLLAYGRIGRNEIVLQDVDLQSLVREVTEQLAGEIRNRSAVVRVSPQLMNVLGHRSTLLHIITNLMSNAMKFVPNGVSPEVTVWTEKSDHSIIRLWIEDNGIGIDEEHHQRIFRAFERLHGIESYPGTGMGLAIVARSCEQLGAQVGVESEGSGGSRFWVELCASSD